MLKNFIKKIHIIHNIYIKHGFLVKKKSYAMDKEDLAILDNVKKYKSGFMLTLDVIIQSAIIILICFIKKIGEE